MTAKFKKKKRIESVFKENATKCYYFKMCVSASTRRDKMVLRCEMNHLVEFSEELV